MPPVVVVVAEVSVGGGGAIAAPAGVKPTDPNAAISEAVIKMCNLRELRPFVENIFNRHPLIFTLK